MNRIQNFVLNKTTTQYIEYEDENQLQARLWYLLEKENGQSHWKKTDHIVFVPNHLNQYVMQNYNEITTTNFNVIHYNPKYFTKKLKMLRYNDAVLK